MKTPKTKRPARFALATLALLTCFATPSGAQPGAEPLALYTTRDRSVLRLRVDRARERLWVLDIGAVHVFDLQSQRRVATVPLANWLYAAHATNCLPDLQLDARGAAYVSDNAQPKLWRIDPQRFTVTERAVTLASRGAVDAGFSALVIAADGAIFAAMAAPGVLWRIDNQFRGEEVPLTSALHGACAIEAPRQVLSDAFTFWVHSVAGDARRMHRVDLLKGAARAHVTEVPLEGTRHR